MDDTMKETTSSAADQEFPNLFNGVFRSLRHNPCFMKPTTAVMMLVMSFFWLVSFLLRFPIMFLGVLFGPLFARSFWMIEFLYPTGIARWSHLFMIRLIERSRKLKHDDVNKGYHSRAIETRIEVVKDRVYIHPLPQFLDNLGYLVVCLPCENRIASDKSTIVAFVVDCGDASAIARQISLISEIHYQQRPVQIQSIFSTHKHHDHTAGNGDLLKHPLLGNSIKHIFGGAVEQVPFCNFLLADGDYVPLPSSPTNDMNDVIEVEAIATPGHTRGSMTYALRPKFAPSSLGCAFLFTGDTMFSGGGGVPFEADTDSNQEAKSKHLMANSFIKASASLNAVERCFAEILYRSVKEHLILSISSGQLLVFPGHEYTFELLNRQMISTECSKWRNTSPAVFFETLSHFYVALQRRSLPQSTGKLLCVPSTIRTEISINPHYRSLKLRGEAVINSIRQWNQNWAIRKVSDDMVGAYGANDLKIRNPFCKTSNRSTESSETQWNLNARILNETVFTTVYTAELDAVIEDLRTGRIHPSDAATQLDKLKSSLHTNIVSRRPVPGTLPTGRTIYKALVGFVLLGSSPTALTLADSRRMKLKPPIDSNSDRICISKRRMIAVLYFLGLLDADHAGEFVVAIIQNLWKEAFDYGMKSCNSHTLDSKDEVHELSRTCNPLTQGETSPENTDIDSSWSAIPEDQVTLGSLKWIIYGIPEFKQTHVSFCVPCSTSETGETPSNNHPAGQSNWKVHAGELVRHDLVNCKVSASATGRSTSDSRRRKKTTVLRVDIESPPFSGYGSTEFVNAIDIDSSDVSLTNFHNMVEL